MSLIERNFKKRSILTYWIAITILALFIIAQQVHQQRYLYHIETQLQFQSKHTKCQELLEKTWKLSKLKKIGDQKAELSTYIAQIPQEEQEKFKQLYEKWWQLVGQDINTNRQAIPKELAIQTEYILQQHEQSKQHYQQKAQEWLTQNQQLGIMTTTLIVVSLFTMMLFIIRPVIYKLERYLGGLTDANRNLRQLNKKIKNSHEELSQKNEILEEAAHVLDQKNQVIRQSRDELEEQRRLLEETNEDITQSIRYAKRIQLAIIPEPRLIEESFQEAFVFSQPKDIISGDFHWFSDKHEQKVVVAADCTGHGVPGALMTMIGSSLINEIVNEKGVTDPQDILHTLDIRIRNILQSKNNEQATIHDGIDMAVISIDESNNTLYYSAAHNPLFYIEGNEIHRIRGSKFPVGSLQYGTEKSFEQHIIHYQSNTPVYIFSDGFQDQIGESNGRKYMTRRFREFILKVHELPMAEQKQLFQKELDNWKGALPQVDDILIIGVRL